MVPSLAAGAMLTALLLLTKFAGKSTGSIKIAAFISGSRFTITTLIVPLSP